MNIKKVNIPTPLSFPTRESLEEIGKQILSQNINCAFEGKDPGYWCITISPSGEIIKADSDIKGHPDMAEKMIYPKDIILKKLFEYLYRFSKSEIDNNICKSFFMIVYGYINIDGHINNNIECRYNPAALTASTRFLPESMKGYCTIYSTMDEVESDKETIELSKIVPFFKKRILALLESFNLQESEFDQLLVRLGKTETDFFYEIFFEYYDKQKEGQRSV